MSKEKENRLAVIERALQEACISNSNLAAQMTSARLEIARQQREITRMLTALDELTAENKELKLDLAAAEHYTTDDLTSPARLCVKCRQT